MRPYLILALVAAASTPVFAAAPAFSPIQSAQQCKNCHAQIYQQWTESWMSRSWSNPVFQREFQQWRQYSAARGSEDRSCLRCHAPATQFSTRGPAEDPVAREGVTCDICHRVAQARNINGLYQLVFDPRGDVKHVARSKGTPHRAALPSAPLRDATLCAGCHWHTTEDGQPLERTFKEWQQSTYAADGITCIDCHMRRLDQAGKPFSHRFPGGRSNSPLLQKAATLRIVPGVRKDQVNIVVENSGVGHAFPTGGAHPSSLILDFKVYAKNSDRVLFSAQRIYETPDSARISGRPEMDTTLGPKEKRNEIFQLPFATSNHRFKATLTYRFLPDSLFKTLDPRFAKKYYAPTIVYKVESN